MINTFVHSWRIGGVFLGSALNIRPTFAQGVVMEEVFNSLLHKGGCLCHSVILVLLLAWLPSYWWYQWCLLCKCPVTIWWHPIRWGSTSPWNSVRAFFRVSGSSRFLGPMFWEHRWSIPTTITLYPISLMILATGLHLTFLLGFRKSLPQVLEGMFTQFFIFLFSWITAMFDLSRLLQPGTVWFMATTPTDAKMALTCCTVLRWTIQILVWGLRHGLNLRMFSRVSISELHLLHLSFWLLEQMTPLSAEAGLVKGVKQVKLPQGRKWSLVSSLWGDLKYFALIGFLLQVADVLHLPGLFQELPRSLLKGWWWGADVISLQFIHLIQNVEMPVGAGIYFLRNNNSQNEQWQKILMNSGD